MLFNAGAVLKDRDDRTVRDPKPGEEPKARTLPNGQVQLYFEESQKRDALHGHVALTALDTTVPSDRKEMEADAAKWVKSVARRESIAQKITEALRSDGWAELPDDHRDVLVERLAQCTAIGIFGAGNATVGPVIAALQSPPQEKPEKRKANGHGKRDGAVAAAAQ